MDTNSQKEDARSVIQLICATRNQHKTREFRELLGDQFQIADLSNYPKIQLPEETGSTFRENAVEKALTVSRMVDKLVIADDSGLEVDALNGAPGMFSARYAGENASNIQNIEKLIQELRRKPDERRSGRFRCVIALAQNGKVREFFEGVVEGCILESPRGANGFGYDPIFQPAGFEQTFAEMMPALKNKISHRAKAVAMLRQYLERERFSAGET
jgi:XTP/dITP diphosphohydrolase